MKNRSAVEVLDDHLRESQTGPIENDLSRKYALDLLVLTGRDIYRGHDGLRQLARMLREELPNAKLQYLTRLAEDELGSGDVRRAFILAI